ncbi:MAG: glutamine-hydrolyzing carbamoyl-phosphate synthase small subunit [Wolbachia endosymbiont of Tyrophagus putrescentiae]|nr:glutamine-hydrolyzing carbamoyl-phosphate synthase small subunit [Wolbachia endosymbiont of Tyrophagus putrescentiae]
MRDVVLVLQDGKCFFGKSIGRKGKRIGEVCFTTGMTGYQHTVTDPSFADQIITFTFPHIGNVGINNKDNEGEKIFASGIVVRELSPASHPSSYVSVNDWLEDNNVVGISGVDTRALTRHLRNYGSQKGMICSAEKFDLDGILQELNEYVINDRVDIANEVSSFGNTLEARYKVVVIDFGVKISIITRLIELGCAVELVQPMKGFAQRVLSMKPDGIIFSNGPGDPERVGENIISEIDIIIRSKIPVFGICMGHQLLAIALGGRTIKMNSGHRGSNHPVYEISSGKVEITSQNHGFVVDAGLLPNDVEITHVSLFDNSVEGMSLKDYPVFSVQYHPEEAPGTHDSHYLFRRFIDSIKLSKVSKICF